MPYQTYLLCCFFCVSFFLVPRLNDWILGALERRPQSFRVKWIAFICRNGARPEWVNVVSMIPVMGLGLACLNRSLLRKLLQHGFQGRLTHLPAEMPTQNSHRVELRAVGEALIRFEWVEVLELAGQLLLLLGLAAYMGSADATPIVSTLVELKADVNEKDAWGSPPIHHALTTRSLCMVQAIGNQYNTSLFNPYLV